MNLIDTLLDEASPQEQQRVHNRMMLAARIGDALSARGWTQKQLAQTMGKSPSEISKWLSGTHNFTADTLSDLSQVLDIKLLCVKEEVPQVVTQTVVRYQTVVVAVSQAHHTSSPVSWTSFQASLGQPVANG
ncbi:helix-turn-helix transcriptional regulator [Fibrella sp. USSR17]